MTTASHLNINSIKRNDFPKNMGLPNPQGEFAVVLPRCSLSSLSNFCFSFQAFSEGTFIEVKNTHVQCDGVQSNGIAVEQVARKVK